MNLILNNNIIKKIKLLKLGIDITNTYVKHEKTTLYSCGYIL